MDLSFATSAAHRRRRRQVEDRLAAAGLLLGPRRLEAGEGGVPEDRLAYAERLAAALGDLGPVFAGFGRYLAHRGDLLTEGQCRALAAIGPGELDAESETPSAAGVLEAELGVAPAELFARFDGRPASVTPLHQVHRAQRADGLPLLVRLPRPGLGELLDRDLALLALLERAWPGERSDLESLTGGYRRHLGAWLDADAQARSLAELAADGGGSDLFRVPRVDPRRTGGRVLTVERLAAEPLDGAAATPPEGAALARRLCLWWLEQALGGRRFPVEADVVVLSDGRLCPRSGCFTTLEAAPREELGAYLRAAAQRAPDAACGHLVRAAGEGAPPPELRRRMRQDVPFRDGGDGDGLASRCLLDWRSLRRSSAAASPAVEDFFRGLSWVSATAHRLDAAGDPLRDALEDLRWRGAWNELAHLAEPERLMSTLESYVDAASLLPQGLERTLPGAAPPAPAEPAPATRSAGSAGGALALALLAVGLATPALTAALPPAAAPWAEGAGTALFSVLALMLLLPRGGRR